MFTDVLLNTKDVLRFFYLNDRNKLFKYHNKLLKVDYMELSQPIKLNSPKHINKIPLTFYDYIGFIQFRLSFQPTYSGWKHILAYQIPFSAQAKIYKRLLEKMAKLALRFSQVVNRLDLLHIEERRKQCLDKEKMQIFQKQIWEFLSVGTLSVGPCSPPIIH